MSYLDEAAMRDFLGRSISSFNENKLHGIFAEIDFRNYLTQQGFADRVSPGGWIARSRAPNFGANTVVLFPEPIVPGRPYPVGRELPTPSVGLHSICATFYQIGISSYYLIPSIEEPNNTNRVVWSSLQLGGPTTATSVNFLDALAGFEPRGRRYNFLRYQSDVSDLDAPALGDEFAKEHVRVTFQTRYLAETADVDGIFWGRRHTYPVEIKEKTAASDRQVGEYFGLDIGPFVKLAFYAAMRGNLHSLFIVREIDNENDRNLVNWWYITFERLAQFASWVSVGGGRSMGGGLSTTVRIPKSKFQILDAAALARL